MLPGTGGSGIVPAMPDAKEENGPGAGLSFEREKIELERERLALERERLESAEARLKEMEEELAAAGRRTFALEPAAAAILAAAVFAVGAVLGGAIGWDAGRGSSPAPRKVLLSRAFVSALRSASGVRLAPFDQEAETAPWMPRDRVDFPENLVIVR